ncbi:hypothetical protein ACFBZI_02630 [Moraxella sp. ZJ142]
MKNKKFVRIVILKTPRKFVKWLKTAFWFSQDAVFIWDLYYNHNKPTHSIIHHLAV